MIATRLKLSEVEFLQLPRDGRKYELVDGEAREVPTGLEHDAIGAVIVALLMPHVRGRGFMSIAQGGFRMASGNVRCPDVSFTRKERYPDGRPPKGFGEGAPDLAVEILSPSDDFADLPRKVNEYFASGAQQVWLLEPDAQRVTLYSSPTDSLRLTDDEEISGGDLLPGFTCRVRDLFDIG